MNRKKCNKLQRAIGQILKIMNDCLMENHGTPLRHLPSEEEMRQLKVLADNLTKTIKAAEVRRAAAIQAATIGKPIGEKGKYSLKNDKAYNVPETFRAVPRYPESST